MSLVRHCGYHESGEDHEKMSTTVTPADDETTTTGDEKNADDKSPDWKHSRVRLDRLESRSFPGRNK